ncbi:MAG TPA: tetratricopeptide repeat protein [Candidatus Hydrogenedentes bacterium]|nr:tetratricopeptide repeat protein [Candidatus Hydrogenedentota bacterium]HPG67167.1 tetratricopeptide repeat protein [Candidatus Hydrogenedentota bacterium]
MAAAKPERYIARNIIYWFGICVAGFVLLTAVRQGGSRITARHEARQLLAEGETYSAQNADLECQRTLDRALRLDPAVSEQIVDRFGGRLIGLPLVYSHLSGLVADPPGYVSREALVKLSVLMGDIYRAGDPISGGPPGRRDGASLLLLGRLALDKGDLFQARDHYDRYWANDHDRRLDAVSAVFLGNPDGAPALRDAGRRLFWAGLWEEAFSAFDSARKRGGDDPELQFYEGVQLELAGQPDEALRAYRKVLERAPNHLMTLKRVVALETH